MAHPDINDLIYVLYDGQADDDDFDKLDVTDASRLIIHRYERKDFEARIKEVGRRIIEGNSIVEEALELDCSIESVIANR